MRQNRSATDVRLILSLLPEKLLTVTVFWWTFPISIFLAVFATPEYLGSMRETLIWAAIGSLGHLAMLPFILYGREKTFGEQLMLVLLMGFVRGGTMSVLALLFGLSDSLPPFERILNSMIAIFYWAYAGAIVVEYGIEFRSKIKTMLMEILEKNIVGLPEAAKASQHKVVEVLGHLQERITIMVGTHPTKDEIKAASNEIDKLINDFIRPLSHSNWKDGELVWIRAGFISVLKRTLAINPIPVIPVLVLCLPFSLITQFTRIGFSQTFQVQIIWTSLALISTKLVFKNQARKSDYLRENLIFLFLISATYIFTFFAQIFSPIELNLTISEMIAGYTLSAVTQITAFLIGSLLLALHRDQEFLFDFIGDVIKAGNLEKLLSRAKSGNLDKEYSQYLHAEVQSQLLACKLLLLKAAESEFEIFPPEITKQITERMEALKRPYEKPVAKVPAKRLENLRQSWAGLAEIEFNLSAELNELQSSSEILSQLIEEAIVNSIRHGKAKKISVVSNRIENGFSVEVRDDGLFAEGQGGNGLGSILFNTFTENWSLARDEKTTVLKFEVKD